MKVKVVPLAKQSKKARKAYHAKHRTTWNGLSPVTRVAPDPKVYDRKKEKDRMRKESADF